MWLLHGSNAGMHVESYMNQWEKKTGKFKSLQCAMDGDANSTFMKAHSILGIFPKKNPYRKE